MSNQKKILIFTATYNESENIEELIKKIKIQDFNLDLLIIDDNSPDKTADKITGLQKIYQKLSQSAGT